MAFYDKLRDRLEGKMPGKSVRLLPRSYQIVGRVLILRLKPQLLRYRKTIGEAVVHMLPYVHVVCLEKDIEGITRKPKIEIIAGCKEHQPAPSTQTLHKEYGCEFLLDVSEIMWSKGNKEERQRIVKLVKPGEVVVDMFCGIGYFSIFIAKYCNPKKMYAIDINPKALEYLRKNVWFNKVEDRIEILEGDNRKFAGYLEEVADRIIMGYLRKTELILPVALRMLRKNGMIHLHRAVKAEDRKKVGERIIRIGKKNKCNIEILGVKTVKSFAPRIYHLVYDLKVEKNV